MIKHEINSKVFIDYLQTIHDVYEHLQKHNPAKKEKKVLIVYDNMVVDLEASRKLKPIVAELYMKGK